MVQRNGRVLVPIRLMGYLAAQSDRNHGMWDVSWNQQHPNDVLLTSNALHKTIKFTVNSKTMLINNEPVTLDVPPQKINGRIVLPLRSAAMALEKKIDWLDGLIIIGDESVDLQHPQTLDIKDKIKTQLTDSRKRNDYTKTVTPLTKYGNVMYFYKSIYHENGVTEELYRKVEGQKEAKIQIPGSPVFATARAIGNELYYVSVVNHITELHAFNFADNSSREICAIEQWNPMDGWLADVTYVDNELYINLHYGDLTMGAETLYKVDQAQGSLQEVMRTKSLIEFAKDGDYIYFTDFMFMSGPADNLYRLNTKTVERTPIGESGFVYGVHRTIENGGVGYSSSGALYVRDGYLYTLGYKESDLTDESAVYKINLADRTQVKLTSPTKQFWMVNDRIYYIDASSGYLKSVDSEGGNQQTLVERKVLHVEFYNGEIYYSANANGAGSNLGSLYRYNIANEQEVRLSDKSISSFYAGKAGVYYSSNGYEPGLYKIDEGGHNVSLVKDRIDRAILTDAGMVYTLVYEEGIYAGAGGENQPNSK